MRQLFRGAGASTLYQKGHCRGIGQRKGDTLVRSVNQTPQRVGAFCLPISTKTESKACEARETIPVLPNTQRVEPTLHEEHSATTQSPWTVASRPTSSLYARRAFAHSHGANSIPGTPPGRGRGRGEEQKTNTKGLEPASYRMACKIQQREQNGRHSTRQCSFDGSPYRATPNVIHASYQKQKQKTKSNGTNPTKYRPNPRVIRLDCERNAPYVDTQQCRTPFPSSGWPASTSPGAFPP